MTKRIVLATDGSLHSLRAAEQAIELAKYLPASKIEVVYVVSSESSKTEVLHNWNSLALSDSRKEKFKATEVKAKEAGVEYTIKLLRGDPGEAIVKYANDSKADLVVIGSRGLNALQEFILGSVSHKVAKRTNCPVLIVK